VTVAEYRQYLRTGIGPYVAQEFETWPVGSDADVPQQYLRLQSDIFAYGAWSAGRAMTRMGESAWLYRFAWHQCGPGRGLGAYHGEELAFLSNAFPANWGRCAGERAFGVLLRQYWANFAKTGDPNGPGLPEWPAYSLRTDQIEELGQRIRSVPAAPNLQRFENIMRAMDP
jgi:para-nitrobenzyl esterase